MKKKLIRMNLRQKFIVGSSIMTLTIFIFSLVAIRQNLYIRYQFISVAEKEETNLRRLILLKTDILKLAVELEEASDTLILKHAHDAEILIPEIKEIIKSQISDFDRSNSSGVNQKERAVIKDSLTRICNLSELELPLIIKGQSPYKAVDFENQIHELYEKIEPILNKYIDFQSEKMKMAELKAENSSIHFFNQMIFAILICGTMCFFSGLYFLKTFLLPIKLLSDYAKRVGEGEFTQKIEIHTGDEIEDFAETLNFMASRIADSYADLEKKVLERTESVAEANFELFKVIVENNKAQQTIQEREQQLSIIIDTALDAIVMADETDAIILWNPSAERLFGYTQDEIIGRKVNETIIPHRFRQMHIDRIEVFYETGVLQNPARSYEFFAINKEGKEIPIEMSLSGFKKDTKTFLVAMMRDITLRKEFEGKLNHIAMHDSLTGLPNSRLFYDRLSEALKRANRSGKQAALLFIDLDGFKKVNDEQGHDIGDKVLVEFSERLRGCLREIDTAARLGGDEFAVIIQDLDNTKYVDLIAERILKAAAEPHEFAGGVCRVSASVGIAIYPAHGENTNVLLKNADSAMYQAKNCGKNRFVHFETLENQNTQKTPASCSKGF